MYPENSKSPNESIQLNVVDTITLDYLADIKTPLNNDESLEEISKEDLLFYRKRLNNVFKERIKMILTNKDKKDDINELIIKLSNKLIKEFKHDDFYELQQDELKDITTAKEIENLPINDENFDELLFSKQDEKLNTLDTFVKYKTIKIDEKVDYPKINKHDLKNNNLRYKGIKKSEKKPEKKAEKKAEKKPEKKPKN